MIRKILSIIAGYAVFAVSAVLLFNVTGHHPHQDAPIPFKIITIAYGIFFSVLSGFVLQLIANQKKLSLNFALALLMSLFAAISMLTSSGSHWTQWFTMLMFAPVSVFGGYLKNRFSNK